MPNEPRTPTCLRGNPEVCPIDECPSQFICIMKAKADADGTEYGIALKDSIEAALREYGPFNAKEVTQ